MKPELNQKWVIMQPLMLSVMMIAGIMIGYKMNEKRDYALIDKLELEGQPPMIGRVEELLRFVENRYVDKINSEELLDEALHSVFRKLDPHSVYIPPSELEEINDQMNGEFYGIGIETFMINDTVIISGVLDNSPAMNAGLQVFDKILLVNDSIVAGKGLEFNDIRKMLRSQDATPVNIKIIRKKEEKTISVTPAKIPVSTVTSALTLKDSIAYISLDRFSSNTYREFMQALESLFESGKAKHLIIDLRNNPGGYLPEATNILCQIFEDKNRLLVYTEGRNNKRNEYKSTGKRFFDVDKVAVLIDENSASASEIIAGAIQDWDRGVIVGRRSFGKGLVQEQYDLNNGGAVRLTVARYYTPSGRCIQRDYADHENYDEDIHSRYINGQMFDKDIQEIKDSSFYSSLVLNRRLYASGGIYPDIFVPLDSIFITDDFINMDSYLPEFVFKSINEGKIKILGQSEVNIQIPTVFYEELQKYAGTEKRYDAGFLAGKFENMIKYFAIKYQRNKNEASRFFAEKDPFVRSALQFIQSSRSLKEL